ncbi:MAG: histidinol dehydrogenase [Betaproteobacteria bacterium]|nr:MAG: histidinol dehydrogenase [Betaproteobacteria bacterium]
MKLLDSSASDFFVQLDAMTHFAGALDEQVDRTAAEILNDVRARGDAAVLDYTRKFDRLNAPTMQALELTKAEMKSAYEAIDADLRNALHVARDRIESYHQRQASEGWRYTETDGTQLGVKITPLDRVGLYVPGGKAAYPSSLLMNAVPAKVAGVGEVVMVVPTPDGVKNAAVLAAAHIANVDRVFTIGGAQAVGALAYGTQTIPQVDKIVGPGNAYVAAAKRRVFGIVGIDMIAGPSEILVIADDGANPDWVAMDLFSQAEHDEVAQSILLTPSAALIDKVQASIAKLLPSLPRADIIRASLANRGVIVKTRSFEEACDISNRIAPEHLELSVADPETLLPLLKHAGAIFMGYNSSESLGDYVAGTNHVLPTSRSARFSSPLGVYDFQKRTSLIYASAAGAKALGKSAATIAYAEGLQAHARAAELRME